MWGAFGQCARRAAELAPTSVVIVGADHYMLFGTACLPSYLIGTGDVDGPLDAMPGLKRGVIPNSEALATHIAADGHARGFDWAVARALTVDHAIAIPNQLIVQPLRGQPRGRHHPVYGRRCRSLYPYRPRHRVGRQIPTRSHRSMPASGSR